MDTVSREKVVADHNLAVFDACGSLHFFFALFLLGRVFYREPVTKKVIVRVFRAPCLGGESKVKPS